MGYNTVIPNNSSFASRNKLQSTIFSTIHRAVVTDLHLEKGTVNVSLETVSHSAEVTIPLIGLSMPANSDAETSMKSSSWGRYIPQIGDMLLVAFSANGNLHALGYSAMYYKGFEVSDMLTEETGGIGWGKTSGKSLKPGDWDFKSSRESYLYLGDCARLSSGPYSIVLSSSTQDVTVTTSLHLENIGVSKLRFGDVRRFVLPTDLDESYIACDRVSMSGFPETAQEATINVKCPGLSTSGSDIALWSIGDVIDDAGVTASIMRSESGNPVRKYFKASDSSGLITTYEEIVDSIGNYALSSDTAILCEWDTKLANWKISNLTTEIASTTSILLDSILVKLGGNAAVSSVLKGTEFVNSFSTFLTNTSSFAVTAGSVMSSTVPLCVGPLEALKPGFTALVTFFTSFSASCISLNSSLNGFLSQKVKVE
jgi:hypothetical protein